MLESDLNAMISRSLSWGYKIPDPPRTAVRYSSPRPFDGMGFLAVEGGPTVLPFVWEAKFQRTWTAFNFGDIREHQIENLRAIADLYRGSENRVLALLLLGINTGRGTDLLAFDIDWIVEQMAAGKKSVLGKELESLRGARSLQSYKNEFPLEDRLLSCIVRAGEKL